MMMNEINHLLNDVRDDDDDYALYVREMIMDEPPMFVVMLNAEDRELLTRACLVLSLCPLHRIDYAICFDDENDECRAVRMIHPIHDT